MQEDIENKFREILVKRHNEIESLARENEELRDAMAYNRGYIDGLNAVLDALKESPKMQVEDGK